MNKTGGHNQMVQDEDAWFEAEFEKQLPFVDLETMRGLQRLCEIGSKTHGNGDWRNRDKPRDSAGHFWSHVQTWEYLRHGGVVNDTSSGMSVLYHILFNLQELISKERGEK